MYGTAANLFVWRLKLEDTVLIIVARGMLCTVARASVFMCMLLKCAVLESMAVKEVTGWDELFELVAVV